MCYLVVKVPNRNLLDFLAGSSPLLVKQRDPLKPSNLQGAFHRVSIALGFVGGAGTGVSLPRSPKDSLSQV